MKKTEQAVREALDYCLSVEVTHILSTTALEILGYAEPLKEDIRNLMRTEIDWTAPGSVHRIQPDELDGVLEGAGNEVTDGFQRLKSQALVSLWGGLEVLTEDLFVAWVAEFPQSLEHEVFQKLRVPFADFIRLDEESRIRTLYQTYVGSLPGARGMGVSRFEATMQPLGLSGHVDPDVARAIYELHLLRNLIVHQAGRADLKFRQTEFGAACPLGERVDLHDRQFRNYVAAVSDYGHTLLQRVTHRACA
jgi:hypothetical protein